MGQQTCIHSFYVDTPLSPTAIASCTMHFHPGRTDINSYAELLGSSWPYYIYIEREKFIIKEVYMERERDSIQSLANVLLSETHKPTHWHTKWIENSQHPYSDLSCPKSDPGVQTCMLWRMLRKKTRPLFHYWRPNASSYTQGTLPVEAHMAHAAFICENYSSVFSSSS